MPEELDVFLAAAAELDPSSSTQITSTLKKHFESPPTKHVALCLGLESLSDDEVRQLLYGPSSYHLSLYPQLLVGEPKQPLDMSVSANKVQAITLCQLWLVHGRCWERMSVFIQAGGLKQLVNLLLHPQPILASEAMQLLIYATHQDMYNWNPTCNSQMPATTQQHGSQPSSDSSSTEFTANSSNRDNLAACSSSRTDASAAGSVIHPAAGKDSVLWRELLQLQEGPLFTSLLKLSPDIFPNSGHMALQFLAFYLPWLQRWWCKDGVLQLSTGMLAGLAAWSTRPSCSKEERQLAADLLADFSSHGPAPCSSAQSSDAAAVLVDCGGEPELRVVADRTLVNARPGSEAERLKAAGNDAFKAKDWSSAVQLYSAALDVPVPHEALVSEGPRRATYHANRAAAYLEKYKEAAATAAAAANTQGTTPADASSSADSSPARWREVGGVLDGLMLDSSSPEAQAQLLQAAVMDCKAALDLVPTHAKAHFRLATALRAQRSLMAARAAATAAGQHAGCQADRTAAAQLEEVIARDIASRAAKQNMETKQQQQQEAQQQQKQQQQQPGQPAPDTLNCAGVVQQDGRRVSAPAPGAKEAASIMRPSQTKPESVLAVQSGGHQANPLDQLLRQFEAAIKQQGTSNPQKQQQPIGSARAPAAPTQQPRVLLPTAGQQLEPDQQLLSDQLLLPGSSSSSSSSHGLAKKPQARKPLIQEVPSSSFDVVDAVCTVHRARQTSLKSTDAAAVDPLVSATLQQQPRQKQQQKQQQQLHRPTLEELLDELD